MKYYSVEVQARAPPSPGWLPGQTHLAVSTLTPATPILALSCPPVSKPQLQLARIGELGTQRHTSLCCPLPPPAPSSHKQTGESQRLPSGCG